LSYCKTKGITFRQARRSEGHRLAELLEEGLPEWDVLLLTALQVDRRTRLYKRFEEKAVVLDLGIGRDRSGRISRDSLLEFVQQRLRQAGKTLEPQAREVILLRAGNELRALQQEIEKLLLFVGDRSSIRASDVEMIVTDRGEGWVFDLTRSMAERDAITALGHLRRLLNQGEHPLKILGTLAGELRRLISARQLLDGKLYGLWKRGMTYPQFQQNILKEGSPLVMRNPYGDYMCFQKADHFSLNQLCSYMEVIFAADLRLKSSTSHPQIVLERLVLALCLGSPRTHGPRGYGAKP
jgi:DNA polymerase III subunit delta